MEINFLGIGIVFSKDYFALCFGKKSLECRFHWFYIDLCWFGKKHQETGESTNILYFGNATPFFLKRKTLVIFSKKIF